jgi:hypothetical protein
MSSQPASPYDFGETQVKIFPANGKTPVDVTRLVQELNFFENLKDPYVSGTLLIIDSANVFNYVNFLGQERIDIIVTDVYKKPQIQKSFAITSVRKQEKTNDSTSAYVISFIDLHMYRNQKITFSKTYNGKPDSIINSISTEFLGVPVIGGGSAQSSMRVITPLTSSALESMIWLKNRCTTSSGAPFFLHSSLQNNNLSLIDLNALLGQSVFNTSEPFKYSTPNRPSNSSYSKEEFSSLSHKIASLNMTVNQDVLDLLDGDGYGSHYNYIDTTELKAVERHYDLTEPLGALTKPNGTVDYETSLPSNMGDPLHTPKANSSYVSQIVTTKLFENIFSYNEELTVQKHALKDKSKGLKKFAIKGAITLNCPGYEFFGKDLIGKNQIDVSIPKDRPFEEDNVSEDEMRDRKRSGKYVITNMRHMFKNSMYSVTLTAIKIDNDKKLPSEMAYTGQ